MMASTYLHTINGKLGALHHCGQGKTVIVYAYNGVPVKDVVRPSLKAIRAEQHWDRVFTNAERGTTVEYGYIRVKV